MSIRLLRSTATTPDKKPSLDTHFIVRASHLDEDTYLAIQKGDSFSAISISSDDAEAFIRLLNDKFNTLWAPKQNLALNNGSSHELESVTVRLAELRGSNAPQTVRGILCFVSLQDGHEKLAQTMIADVLEVLGFADARKVSKTWPSSNRVDEIKLWCDAVNSRS
jgi:hypothetical protein